MPGSPLDPEVMRANHDPAGVWDPTVDYAMMSRNVRAFMSLYHCGKPVVCQVHGFCVAGGTDMALCSDLLVIAADAKIGYPPARDRTRPPRQQRRCGPIGSVPSAPSGCSSPATRCRAPRRWSGGWPSRRRTRLDLEERTEALVARIARVPVNQLRMMKLLVNQSLYAQGLQATQVLGTVFDGVARHTAEGYAFQGLAAREGFRAAVRDRDEGFGDLGPSTFKG